MDSLTNSLDKQSRLQHSTSHSVNITHLKLVLCHDALSQAFLFQFFSGLFLSIYQNERQKPLTYHSLFCYQSGFLPVCILYFQAIAFFIFKLLQLFSLSNPFISLMTTTVTKTQVLLVSEVWKALQATEILQYTFHVLLLLPKETKVWYLTYMRNKVLILLGTRRHNWSDYSKMCFKSQVWRLVYTIGNILKAWKYFFFACCNGSSTFK